MSNDDNSLTQMTALISVLSFMLIILISKGPSKEPPDSAIFRSPAIPTQLNVIVFLISVMLLCVE